MSTYIISYFTIDGGPVRTERLKKAGVNPVSAAICVPDRFRNAILISDNYSYLYQKYSDFSFEFSCKFVNDRFRLVVGKVFVAYKQTVE